MIIFIRNIPMKANTEVLRCFVNDALRGGIFHKAGYILNCEILQLRDHTTSQVEHHGLVEIDSDHAAKRAIHILNGQKLLNRPVTVREFVTRSAHNERRQDFYSMKAYSPNRRVSDRRRYLQKDEIHHDHLNFTADSKFAKVHYANF